MKDQPQVEERILAITRRVQDELDLSWLTVATKFSTATPEERVAAEATADWEYRQVSILWNLPTVAVIENDELEGILIHELVHALIAPLWSSIPVTVQNKLAKLNELATENVARAILAARDIDPCLFTT